MESVGEILKKRSENKSLTNTKTSSKSKPPLPEAPSGGDVDCPICGGMGFYVPDVAPIDPQFGRAVRCSCRAAEDEEQRLDRLAQLSQLGALQHCTFDAFLPAGHGLTPNKQRNLKVAYEICRSFAENPSGWLVLKGGYGCGKTHLAAAIANARLTKGQPALFVNTPDLLDHLRAAYSPHAVTGYDDRFNQVRNAGLLILDDLGAQSNTEWAQEKLYQIFNHRYNARLPTVITTNQELEAIEIRIQSRMVDPGLVQIIHIAAPDFRRAGVAQDQSDLSTLGLHSDKTFDTFDLRDEELTRAQSTNLERAKKAAAAFAADPQDWLVFYSVGFGNGKTHLAAAIANDAAKRGEEALFVVAPDLLDHLRATFNPASGARLDARFNEVKKASLLVLDDLGTESATAWAREKLYQLFNYRYSARLPTVITTAIHIDELDQRLATRMLDGNRCTVFAIDAPSYRGKKIAGKRRRKRS